MSVILLYECGCNVSRMGGGIDPTGLGFCEKHLWEVEAELQALARKLEKRARAASHEPPTVINAEAMAGALEQAIELGGEAVLLEDGSDSDGGAARTSH
jgi:hypothetical protein